MAKKRNDIIADSLIIKKSLRKRFDELSLSYSKIENDAVIRGRKGISKSNLSRYFSDNRNINGLSHENIIWLCFRYSIDISLNINMRKYNETEALLNLKKIF